MPLDPRLETAAKLVRQGAVAADIGADHGRLICHLVASGRCPRGFACDINAGPLSQARAEVSRQGLEGRVELLLTDGLDGLEGRDAEDYLLLGMGGDLIGQLLTRHGWTRSPSLRFILQPMTKADHLRALLAREGFRLLSEAAVASGRFVYSVMLAAWDGIAREADDFYAWTGLVTGETAPGRAYLAACAARAAKKAAGLARAGDREEAARYRALEDKVKEKMRCTQ